MLERSLWQPKFEIKKPVIQFNEIYIVSQEEVSSLTVSRFLGTVRWINCQSFQMAYSFVIGFIGFHEKLHIHLDMSFLKPTLTKGNTVK